MIFFSFPEYDLQFLQKSNMVRHFAEKRGQIPFRAKQRRAKLISEDKIGVDQSERRCELLK